MSTKKKTPTKKPKIREITVPSSKSILVMGTSEPAAVRRLEPGKFLDFDNLKATLKRIETSILALNDRFDDAARRDDNLDSALSKLVTELLSRETQTRTFVSEIEDQLGVQIRTQNDRMERLIKALTEVIRRRKPQIVPDGWVMIFPGPERDAVMAGKIRGEQINGSWWADPMSLKTWDQQRTPTLHEQPRDILSEMRNSTGTVHIGDVLQSAKFVKGE